MAQAVSWWKRRVLRYTILGIVAIVFATVAWLRPWQGFSPRPAVLSTVLANVPAAVAPGIYILGRSRPAAVYMVETSDGLVLIDSGLEANAATVMDQILELGFDVKRLKAILLTHVHADHSLGAAALRRRTGAKIYAGRGDSRALRTGAPREAFVSIYFMPRLTLHATPPDVEVADDETIAFNESRFTVIAEPGHTPGSICYLLERPGLRALFTGDVIQQFLPSSRGDVGTYAAYLPPRFGGDARDYLRSLRRLRALPLPDLVLPGHPRMDPTPQSPRLTEARWRGLLDQSIADLERLLRHFQTDGAQFLDGNARELLPGLHYFGNIGPAAVYCLATADGAYLFDAPGGPELTDLLARRFQALGWEKKIRAIFLTSVDKKATAGLTAIVKNARCRVVTPAAGIAEVRKLCPDGTEIITGEAAAKAGWFEVESIPIAGLGTAAADYRFRWAGKTVLISGRTPLKLNMETSKQLFEELTAVNGSTDQYLRSLNRLTHPVPDLWLPAVPVNGQNAFVYEDDWANVLARQREFLNFIFRKR